jgi:hypothetical protein
MVRNLISLTLIVLILAGCYSSVAKQATTPAINAPPTSTTTILQNIATETPVTSLTTVKPPPSNTPLPTPSPTSKPTATPSFPSQPLIHDQPGDIYETVFSITVGQGSIIEYFGGGNTEVNGPNAIAVLPDESFLIADPVGNRLLHYNMAGSLLNTIELEHLGIKNVADLRIKGQELFLLETSYQKYRVHRLTLDGALITSVEIPYNYSIGEKDYTIENGLTGIIIDCENNIILEIASGSKLLPLLDVQNLSDPTKIMQGLLCNDKRYQITTPGLWQDPQISIGSIKYQTKLTHGLGGLSFWDIFQNGNLYVDRSDVVNDQVIKVDQTVHYIDPDGNVQGIARIPLSEYYFPVMRKMAISQRGEVFAILPRSTSIDIIRLNFYTHLDPLIPGAVTPQITRVP